MKPHEALDSTTRADALMCQGAMLVLRARRMAGVAEKDMAPDLNRLLSAASLELESDPGSIPATMRRASCSSPSTSCNGLRFPHTVSSAVRSDAITHGHTAVISLGSITAR